MKVTLSVTLWGRLEAGPPIAKQRTILEGAVQFHTGVTNSARDGVVTHEPWKTSRKTCSLSWIFMAELTRWRNRWQA